MKLAQMIDQIQKTHSRGKVCQFVKLGEKWGIKAYEQKSRRDRSWENQKEWSQFGLTPPVGKKFQLGIYYCFLTRVAKPIIDQKLIPYDGDHYSMWMKMDRAWWPRIKMANQEFRKKVNREIMDNHIENWGYFEGKFVLIDCGED